MNKLLALGLAVVSAAALQAATNKGVEGSPHDLSQETWNTRKGVCSPCHAAHNTDPNQIAPLWTHATTAASFTMYSSPTFDGKSSQGAKPDGASLACLSCHDGTVAINQSLSGTISGGTPDYIDDGAKISNDLHVTHPISFDYTDALATTDGGLEKPSTYKIGDPKSDLTVTTAPVPAAWDGTSLTGKTIKEALLEGDRMQCSSCHDVHKLVGSAPSSGIMVKISGSDTGSPTRGSLICRTCHIK